MLRLCRSLQHTTSPIWRLGFSTISPDIATCCSVLVHSQQFPFLLQTLNSSSVWHSRPGATRKPGGNKQLWEKPPWRSGSGGKGVPAPRRVLLLG